MKSHQKASRRLAKRFREMMVRLVQHAAHDLDGLSANPEFSMHRVRMRMKKLRAIVSLLKKQMPRATRKAINSSTRKLKDAFTSHRDAQVGAVLLAEIGVGETAPPRPPKVSSAMKKHLRAELEHLEHLVAHVRLPGLDWESIHQAYIAGYAKGRRLMRACRKDHSRLHPWRRPVKELYFHSLLLRGASGMKRRVRRSRTLGHWLGHAHDLQLLLRRASAGQDKDLQELLERRQDRLKRRIFKLAAKLYASPMRSISEALKLRK